MALRLAPDRFQDRIAQPRLIHRGVAQHAAQIGAVVLAEAHIQHARAGQAHAVAGFTKIMRHRRDETDPPPGFLDREIPRRAAGLVIRLLQRPAFPQPGADQGQRQVLVGAVVADLAHRHRLDQAEVEAVFAAPGDHAVELAFVHALHGHRVDLDVEPRGLGGEDAVQRRIDLPPAGERGEGRGVQAVEGDIDPPHAGRADVVGHLHQLRAVGGDRQLLQPAATQPRAEAAEQRQHALPHQRLPARQADLLDAEVDEGAAKPVEFLERQDLRLRQEGHVFRHAIDAAQVAAVGDRDPEIADGTPERIDHGWRNPPGIGGRPSGAATPRRSFLKPGIWSTRPLQRKSLG